MLITYIHKKKKNHNQRKRQVILEVERNQEQTQKGNKVIFDFMFTKKAPNEFKQSNTKYNTKTLTCWGEDTICCWTIWGILVTYK